MSRSPRADLDMGLRVFFGELGGRRRPCSFVAPADGTAQLTSCRDREQPRKGPARECHGRLEAPIGGGRARLGAIHPRLLALPRARRRRADSGSSTTKRVIDAESPTVNVSPSCPAGDLAGPPRRAARRATARMDRTRVLLDLPPMELVDGRDISRRAFTRCLRSRHDVAGAVRRLRRRRARRRRPPSSPKKLAGHSRSLVWLRLMGTPASPATTCRNATPIWRLACPRSRTSSPTTTRPKRPRATLSVSENGKIVSPRACRYLRALRPDVLRAERRTELHVPQGISSS